MPADLNRVSLIGRCTKDPEMRHSASGEGVLQIRLACSSRAKQDNGEWGDKPNYFDVVVFGRLAELMGSTLAKGSRIGVDGRLSWREWMTKDGDKRQSVEVVANDVYYLDPKGSSSAGDDGDIPF
jgi:single-strand DNA-binding protein